MLLAVLVNCCISYSDILPLLEVAADGAQNTIRVGKSGHTECALLSKLRCDAHSRVYEPTATPSVFVSPGPGHANRVRSQVLDFSIALPRDERLLISRVCRNRCSFRIQFFVSNVNKYSIWRPQTFKHIHLPRSIVINLLCIICFTAMVRFFGGKVTVKLSVADLEHTAGTLAETSQSAKQRSHIEQYTLQSIEGLQDEFVPERYIRDPEDGMSTHFLGKNKHIPFLMAQAGYYIVNETPSKTRNTRSTRNPLYGLVNSSKR